MKNFTITQEDINNKALEVIWRTDGYKLGHVVQFPAGTTKVYSNLTPRSVYGGVSESQPGAVVMYGMKKFLEDLLQDFDYFFASDINIVGPAYKKRLEEFAGLENVNIDHIYKLHEIGYLPLEIKAIPEGTIGLIGQPLLTITNTDDSAYWLVNYLETWLSAEMWWSITSATVSWNIRRMLEDWVEKTGGDINAIDFNVHDFSYRGLPGIRSASVAGTGHLLSFTGSDSLSSMDLILNTYPETTSYIQGGVPASEHSVMTANAVDNEGIMDESPTIKRLLELYPTGLVSVVSDSYDYWKMVTETLPKFKDQIMTRDGRYVVRPDSGDPQKIICGDPDAPEGTPERKGSLEILWEVFGGTVNEAGYRELDTHIGLIYGDSMRYDRINAICKNMEEIGFAATNVVFGIGSYGFQSNTRDTYGFAVKATNVTINGEQKAIFKDPKTGSGNKKSAKGLLKLVDTDMGRELLQEITSEQESEKWDNEIMDTVFYNGEIMNMEDDFQKLRDIVKEQTTLWRNGEIK